MKKADAAIYLDELRPKANGKCSVKIKITFNRIRKYFATGIELTPDEFTQVMHGQRRTAEQKKYANTLNHYLDKANNIIIKLQNFSFDAFTEAFLETRNTQNSVSFAFDKYIEQLRSEGRVGTAVSYNCAKVSIESFKSNSTFADVTQTFLKNYQNWMLKDGKSISTVGIYLRSLRTIFNQQKIEGNSYPFGKGGYAIPASRNIKKALVIDEIAEIFNYEADPGTATERAKDYWIFLYLSNGMNVKDFCLLKWANIDGNILTYNRAKTQRSKKERKNISVSLKPETMAIIRKWGITSISENGYIFPHLKPGMSADEERATIQQLTKTINKYTKRIAVELGTSKSVTTYTARHSFATVLKRSGVSHEMIGELLGHSSLEVTDNYLGSFENEQIHEQTNALTAFKGKRAG